MIAADGGHQGQDRAVRQGNEQNESFSSCDGLFRGAGADQEAHQQLWVVTGDMDQVAVADVLATAQLGSAHAAAIEDVGEGTFDDLGAQLERRLRHPRQQPRPVVVDGAARVVVAVPARDPLALGLGDPRLPGA